MNLLRASALLSASVATSICTASCGRSPTTSPAAPVATAQAAPAPAPSGRTGGGADFQAAAEPFEVLTEISFSATAPALDSALQKAKAAARGVRTSLPSALRPQFDSHLAAIDTARGKLDRANIALSSIEVYRDLVSAATPGANVPSQVSLLDYAGFRYDADLKATPPRWSDMTQAVAFADENWALIASRVGDKTLSAKVRGELGAMKQAAAQQNRAAAARSSKSELNLVDQLEQYFSSH